MRLLHYDGDGEGELRLTDVFVEEGKIASYVILSHTWAEVLLVDTCCIDKSNRDEFQHAIKSMFRWYQHASRCYAYLYDVSTSASITVEGEKVSELSWYSAFRMKLLAPRVLVFYAEGWTQLGDKASLQQEIHEITAIPLSALQGTPLFEFSANARLQWGQSRQTKLEEDRAYSLVGFFGVDLAPIYDIGYKEAFRRLQDEINKMDACLRDLYVTDPRHDKRRIEDAKGGLLKDASLWILSTSEFQEWYNGDHDSLLWIKGDPGKGKTMLVCNIANTLTEAKKRTDVLAYFFCQATDTRIINAAAALRGLLYMILEQQPSLTSHVQKKYEREGHKAFENSNSWILLTDILTNVLGEHFLQTTYLLVDARDECDKDLPKLVDFITRSSSLSSRIQSRLANVDRNIGLSLELNAESIATAVKSFIHHKEYVAANAQDTFLWVAVIFQSFREVPRRHAVSKLRAIPAGLDALYERMLQQISVTDEAHLCKQILAIAAAVYRPVTIHELGTLLQRDLDTHPEEIVEIVSLCGSFLTLRENVVYFVHQSAVDFISTTASHTIFPHGPRAVHRIILSRSLNIPDPLITWCYSCIYWVDHLCELNFSRADDCDIFNGAGAVENFLRQKYLYWLEALSLCQSLPKGVISMTKLANVVQERTVAPLLSELVIDAMRFLLYHRTMVEIYPLQTYVSALLFSPTQSHIRQFFQEDRLRWVTPLPDMEPECTSCLQTFEGHDEDATRIMFSDDSTIWDTDITDYLHMLEGHDCSIISIAFSQDANQLFSAAEDGTIKT
ncbi:hypothetical protein BU25DRAFT_440399 [Macroventuria anomochaeta]|uniref:Uncharacterized protein n=1 Tax=Macroventuria anomochaeta TaxID=301207 RepID=A0ACB6RZS6_9PLEO|nr:uncharacterized protein BU25DRAFT_440399 [Macroventuria anomochaeta]KAF2626772.1 hypothetical protein BU25DRAFT_440399 [Macroventuria anomochaeta]